MHIYPVPIWTNSRTKERSILKIFALGLPLGFLDFLSSFRTYFTFRTYLQSLYFFSHGSKNIRPLELEGVTSAVNSVKCVPIPAIKQIDQPPWEDEN